MNTAEKKLRSEIGRRNEKLTKLGSNLLMIKKLEGDQFELGIQRSNFSLIGTAKYILAFLNIKEY